MRVKNPNEAIKKKRKAARAARRAAILVFRRSGKCLLYSPNVMMKAHKAAKIEKTAARRALARNTVPDLPGVA